MTFDVGRGPHSTCLLVVGFVLMNAPLAAQERQQGCRVEFTVWDESHRPSGSFSIIDTRPWTASGEVEKSSDQSKVLPVRTLGDRLYFPADLLMPPTVVSVTLERSEPWRQIRTTLVLSTCLQRESLSLTPSDVLAYRTGRVTGCRLGREWWVRSESLFNADEFQGVPIDPLTGEFTILAWIMDRQLVVINRGKHPLKAFATEIRPGSTLAAPLGEFDVSGYCPGED